jgi:PAS domain S-box-containing protein
LAATGIVFQSAGLGPGALLHSLLAKIPVFLWAADRQLRVTSITGAALLPAGVDVHAAMGQPVGALFKTKESQSAHEAALMGTGGVFCVELNGRTLEAYVEPLSGGEAGPVGVAGVAMDITERLVAETALRLSEQSYRSLIEEAPYAICRATESGQLLQANPAMLEMLGHDRGTEEDLLMRDLPDIFASPEDFETFRKTMLAGAAVQGFESTWRRRDGREIQVRLGGRALRSAEDRVLCFDLLAENVTEKKELAARLQQAQKMQTIGQLAGGIAHDFNNLLTVINGYCDLLLLDQPEESESVPGLKLIRQAGERAVGLTQQLLAFSRQQVRVPQAIALNGVVREVAGLSRRVIAENIRIVQRLAPDAGSVMADAAQMHQMLMNLVVNARDAMPEGGTLTIETIHCGMDAGQARQLDVAPGNYAVLTVRDTGVGMDEVVRSHMFEPFFTTKPVGKGTGLGLATVYGLVRQNNGAIAVESRPGAGTTFRIYLPRLGDSESAGDEADSTSVLTRGESTILVVEDDPAVRAFTTTVLRDAGHMLLEASDGDEALEVAQRHRGPIHLLLTDMVMPGLTGTDLAAELRLVRPECRVLLVSGYSETLVGENTIDEGIRYLQKPFSPEQLSRSVNAVLTQ